MTWQKQEVPHGFRNSLNRTFNALFLCIAKVWFRNSLFHVGATHAYPIHAQPVVTEYSYCTMQKRVENMFRRHFLCCVQFKDGSEASVPVNSLRDGDEWFLTDPSWMLRLGSDMAVSGCMAYYSSRCNMTWKYRKCIRSSQAGSYHDMNRHRVVHAENENSESSPERSNLLDFWPGHVP